MDLAEMIPHPGGPGHGSARHPRKVAPTWLACAKLCWRDWVLLVLAIALLIVTEYTSGSRMYITEHMLEQIRYPYQDSTVPSWSVPVYTVFGPPVIFVVHKVLAKKCAATNHAAVLGSIVATISTALITNFFKMQIGRPRPNFFYRCWPDGLAVWEDAATAGQRRPLCHPLEEDDVVDGYRSFPSGHASWSFASMTFLSIYLYHFLNFSKRTDTQWDVAFVVLPIVFATWVASTRVIDYMHFPGDVLAGALIGIVMAWFCFITYFPAGELRKGHGSLLADESTREAELETVGGSPEALPPVAHSDDVNRLPL